MKSREVIIYLAIIHKGNWEEIYQALTLKEEFEEEKAKKVVANMNSKAVTILDDDYPQQLKFIQKPPSYQSFCPKLLLKS